MTVAYRLPEMVEANKKYQLIRDVIAGSNAVKEKGEIYLPFTNFYADISTQQSKKDYNNYLKRATFFNFTARTLRSLLGQVFVNEPEIVVQPALQFAIDDATGGGVSLVQLAKLVASTVIAYGRAGLFVNLPETVGNLSADQILNNYRPSIELFQPWQVINWRTKIIGGKKLLTLVVIERDYVVEDDGYNQATSKEWVVLQLDQNNDYLFQVFRKELSTPFVAYYPTNAAGQVYKEIPFFFIGSVNNECGIDEAPLYEIADINVAHYVNSADYEQSCFVCGQPTLIIIGASTQKGDDLAKTYALGANSAINLPIGGDAKMLQPEHNLEPAVAMRHKEEKMIELGARLVERGGAQRTATEITITSLTENSALSMIAQNVSNGLTNSLQMLATFIGEATDQIIIMLNTDYSLLTSTAADVKEAVAAKAAGAITFSELRAVLRRAKMATLDDKEAKEIIDLEMLADLSAFEAGREPVTQA